PPRLLEIRMRHRPLRAVRPSCFRHGLSVAVIAALAAGTAHAQDATDATDLDRIVVTAPNYVPAGSMTATKSGAPLIETPQSISVVARDQIDLLGFTDVQQAIRYTSGIVGENYGPDLRFDFLTLRGFTPSRTSTACRRRSPPPSSTWAPSSTASRKSTCSRARPRCCTAAPRPAASTTSPAAVPTTRSAASWACAWAATTTSSCTAPSPARSANP